MPKFALPGLCLFALLLLAACAGPQGANANGAAPGAAGATLALSDYLTALVEKDEDRLVSLACPSWQADALLELDAFQAVETSLEGLACRPIGSQDGAQLARCQGKIVARYVSETQSFDLGERVYRLEKQPAGWQVCGYTLK